MSADTAATDDPVDRLLPLLEAASPTLGEGRLLCVDGPAGSGKTTLAARVAEAREVSDTRVVHMDDLYPGWSGLSRVEPQVLGLLAPLSRGRPGGYRRYDWDAGRFAEDRVVEPCPLLVLEGVAAGNLAWARWCTTLVYVEADRKERLARGLRRDGAAMERHWQEWMDEEDRLYAEQRTRERADLVVAT